MYPNINRWLQRNAPKCRFIQKTIDSVLKMNDDQLWRVIQYVAKKSGQDDVSEMKMPSDMSKIRKTLSSLTDSEIESAIKAMKEKKNERK